MGKTEITRTQLDGLVRGLDKLFWPALVLVVVYMIGGLAG